MDVLRTLGYLRTYFTTSLQLRNAPSYISDSAPRGSLDPVEVGAGILYAITNNEIKASIICGSSR